MSLSKSPSPSSLGSTLSTEQERDLYKEKVQNLKILVQKLHQDVRTNHIRLQSSETISALLDDSRKENEKLVKTLQKYKNAVDVLQQRLSRLGGSASVSLQDDDSFVSGPPRQLLDSLVQENSKLKEHLKYINSDPDRLEELTQEVHRLRKQVKELHEKNIGLEQAKSKMLNYLSSSNDEKSAEIARLKRKEEQYERQKETTDILCQSLSEEACTLKQKLQATGEMCQHLAKQIEQYESDKTQRITTNSRPGRDISDAVNKPSESSDSAYMTRDIEQYGGAGHTLTQSTNISSDSDTHLRDSKKSMQRKDNSKESSLTTQVSSASSTSSNTEETVQNIVLSQKLIALEQENAGIKTHLDEVIQVNQKWQKYNDEREEHVKQLQQQMSDMQLKLTAAQSTPISENQQRDIDRILLTAKRRQEEIQEEKEKLEDEFRRVNLELYNAKETITQLEQELMAVRSRQQPQSGSRREDQDRIQVLEQQLQIFSEDFKSERTDRERAQARISELENQLSLYQRQLEGFQTRHMQNSMSHRQELWRQYEREYEEQKRAEQAQRLVAHGVTPAAPQQGSVSQFPQYWMDTTRLNEDVEHAEGGDVIDSLPSQHQTPLRHRGLEGSDSNEATQQPLRQRGVGSEREEMLQCPKCSSEFPVSRHADLLEHIDVCCE